MGFVLEVWTSYRPRAVRLVETFLEGVSAYAGLYCFESVKHHLPLSAWSARVVEDIHAAGTIGVLFIFTLRCLIAILPLGLKPSLWRTRSRRRKRAGQAERRRAT